MLLYGVGSEWDRRKCLGVVGFDHARISDHFSLMSSMVSGSHIHELWVKGDLTSCWYTALAADYYYY